MLLTDWNRILILLLWPSQRPIMY